MPGTINWNATFKTGDSSEEVYAEIYDKKGEIVQSKAVPCRPPDDCRFPMENVEFGTYTAALVRGEDRYYYVEGLSPITAPNDADNASSIELTQAGSEISLNIYVDPA